MQKPTHDLESQHAVVDVLLHRLEQLRRGQSRTAGDPSESEELLERLSNGIRRRSVEMRHVDERIVVLDQKRVDLEEEIFRLLQAQQALLLEEVDRLEAQAGPCWSPTPIKGFTTFGVTERGLHDGDHVWNQVRFESPSDSVEPDCDLLAWKTMEHIADPAGSDLMIIAEIALDGVVVEHEHGYRAQSGEVRSVMAFDRSRWLRTNDAGDVEAFVVSPIETFSHLATPIPPETLMFVEVDLFLAPPR